MIIKWGKTTRVNLESWGKRKPEKVNEAALVRLPNGYVVGWPAGDEGAVASTGEPVVRK